MPFLTDAHAHAEYALIDALTDLTHEIEHAATVDEALWLRARIEAFTLRLNALESLALRRANTLCQEKQ